MKQRTGSMIGVRMDKDVELLVEMAIKAKKFPNASRIGNLALRQFLTPLFKSKKVQSLQAEIGVSA